MMGLEPIHIVKDRLEKADLGDQNKKNNKDYLMFRPDTIKVAINARKLF